MNYYIRHLPLNKDNSFADALEWVTEFEDPWAVLLSDMSRASRYSTEKLAPLDARIFHLPSVVI